MSFPSSTGYATVLSVWLCTLLFTIACQSSADESRGAAGLGQSSAGADRSAGGNRTVEVDRQPLSGAGRLLMSVDDSLYVGEHQSKDKIHAQQRQRSYSKSYTSKPLLPTAAPRPDPDVRKQVQWFEENRYYALKASNDDSLKIRQAPFPASGSPWPMPQVYQPSNVVFRIDPDLFRIFPIGENCDVLEYSFRRILKNTFLDYNPEDIGASRHFGFLSGSLFGSDSAKNEEDGDRTTMPVITTFNVTVLKECDGALPHLDMDESYDLEVKRAGASLIAREVWGALRGLETFSQLVYQDDNDVYLVNRTYIHDFPRFPHRGVLLDTSRHYLDKETLITNLEIMAENKMNVFHWHIVDDNAFPFQSKRYPELSEKGAYDPVTHIYTHEDIADVIEEARLRGIRVIPEFDTPGHTLSWGLGQDNLLTPCYNYRKEPDGFYGPINPILKATYRFLEGLFQEVMTVFKDKYVHLGGDEVPFNCWYSNPFLNSFTKRNNLTDVKSLLNLYEKKLVDIITKIGMQREQGSGCIVWQEVFDNGVKLKPDAIVQVWSGDAFDIGRVTGAGFRALYSTCWYLDYINYGQDWDKYYLCEHIGQMLEDYRVPNQSLIMGGEVSLWTEFADDGSILPRIWPRASAAAERLWSSRYLINTDAAAPRIEEQRCRMIRRGLQVGVLSGPGYCKRSKKLAFKHQVKKDWRLSEGPVVNRVEDKDIKLANVYVLDVNAMYLIPFLIIVCLCCVLFFSSFCKTEQKNGFIAILNFTPGNLRIRPRSLVFAFMAFVIIWCLWSSPMWLHLWEASPNA